MKVLKQEKSKLLPRLDVVAIENHVDKRTPSVNEVKDGLSKLLKADKELILIDHIYSDFGAGNSKIVAYVYDSKEVMDKIIKKGKKQKEAEAKAAEDAKKAAEEAKKAEEEPKAAEEAPAEEPKVEENGKEEGKEEQSSK